jgi:type VI secretion system protein ImpA
MAALNFVELAKPISEEDPCGPDLDGDPDFMNVMARLEVALPASYFRRDDDGRQVAFDRSVIEFPAAFADVAKLLARSKDLRIFVLASKLSILNRDIPAFASCLSVIAAFLADHWDGVHPRAEEGDFIMREVAIQSLDELATVVLPLQHAPLFVSRRIGPFAFRSQLVASGDTRLVEGEQHPDASTIQAALTEADIDDLTTVLGHIGAAREALARMGAIWLEKVGVDHALSFPRLTALLDQIVAFLDAAVARRVPGHQVAGAAAAAPAAQAPAESANSYGSTSCSSILQVKDTLAACLGYFRKMEPSSPAVLLIGQAQQLIGKSLIEVIQIMFPEHVDKAVLEIGDTLKFRLPLERLPAPDGYADAESGDAGEVAEKPAGAAVITTRAEAISGMRSVAAFYRQIEPSHPTPLLMDKACALAQHDFMSLLGNILPEMAAMPERDS